MSTPTPTPALTDEQVDNMTGTFCEAYLRTLPPFGHPVGKDLYERWLGAVEARAKREEREAIGASGVMHVWGFLSGRDDLVSDVKVALCPGELHEVANHIINGASEHGYDVKSWTLRSLDGYLREVHAVWAVDPGMPMWHRFVTASAPWVKETPNA